MTRSFEILDVTGELAIKFRMALQSGAAEE